MSNFENNDDKIIFKISVNYNLLNTSLEDKCLSFLYDISNVDLLIDFFLRKNVRCYWKIYL